MEFCRELGRSFEAIQSEDLAHNSAVGPHLAKGGKDPANSGHNFSTIVVQLQAENTSLNTQLTRARQAAVQLRESQRRWEEERATVQKLLQNVQFEADELRMANRRLQARVRKYFRQLHRSKREMQVAFSAAQRSGLDIGQRKQ